MRTFLLIIVIAWMVFGALATIMAIDKPRETITHGIALAVVITQTLLIITVLSLTQGTCG